MKKLVEFVLISVISDGLVCGRPNWEEEQTGAYTHKKGKSIGRRCGTSGNHRGGLPDRHKEKGNKTGLGAPN